VPLRFHHDRELFRAAVNFTAAQTRFTARLIEKDYFCSLVLLHLSAAAPGLAFKGGTCLAKVHLGFYRLSEDLDFALPTPIDATRAARSRQAAPLKKAVEAIEDQLEGLRVVTPFTGANDSTQYEALVSYPSRLLDGEETISVEVSLREPLLASVVHGSANSVLMDPISRTRLAPAFPVRCLSREEAMAEKLRAALSRREVAIRDFYDIDHAMRRLGFDVHDAGVIELLKRKLTVPGNGPVDTSPARLSTLRHQLEARLQPVLREQEFAEFDLDRAFEAVTEVAAVLT